MVVAINEHRDAEVIVWFECIAACIVVTGTVHLLLSYNSARVNPSVLVLGRRHSMRGESLLNESRGKEYESLVCQGKVACVVCSVSPPCTTPNKQNNPDLKWILRIIFFIKQIDKIKYIAVLGQLCVCVCVCMFVCHLPWSWGSWTEIVIASHYLLVESLKLIIARSMGKAGTFHTLHTPSSRSRRTVIVCSSVKTFHLEQPNNVCVCVCVCVSRRGMAWRGLLHGAVPGKKEGAWRAPAQLNWMKARPEFGQVVMVACSLVRCLLTRFHVCTCSFVCPPVCLPIQLPFSPDSDTSIIKSLRSVWYILVFLVNSYGDRCL